MARRGAVGRVRLNIVEDRTADRLALVLRDLSASDLPTDRPPQGAEQLARRARLELPDEAERLPDELEPDLRHARLLERRLEPQDELEL